MVFNDILEILFKDGFDYYSSEEGLKYMLGFYFNNIRDIRKEFNFLTEVKSIIKEKEATEEEVPNSLIKFYEIIEPFYYDSKLEL